MGGDNLVVNKINGETNQISGTKTKVLPNNGEVNLLVKLNNGELKIKVLPNNGEAKPTKVNGEVNLLQLINGQDKLQTNNGVVNLLVKLNNGVVKPKDNGVDKLLMELNLNGEPNKQMLKLKMLGMLNITIKFNKLK